MKTNVLAALLVVLFSTGVSIRAFGKCPEGDLSDYLEVSNKQVISYLISLSDSVVGKRIEGVYLCDSSNLLKNTVYSGKYISKPGKQHVYLFVKTVVASGRSIDCKFAVAWIDSGGRPLSIPFECEERFQGDCIAEAAHVLSGDSYTGASVMPRDGVVILEYPNDVWLSSFNQKSKKHEK